MLLFELFPLFMLLVSIAALTGLYLADRQARAQAAKQPSLKATRQRYAKRRYDHDTPIH